MIRTENPHPYITFRASHFWREVRDGNRTAFRLMERHYSFQGKTDLWGNPRTHRFVGPGERIVLLEKQFFDALFVWRKEKFRADGQQGVNCAVFRNEGNLLSSDLIIDAEQWAQERWGHGRVFTFVDRESVQSANPGYCFKCAGWKVCGESKKKSLIILEKYL
jgi:hypothetical protein